MSERNLIEAGNLVIDAIKNAAHNPQITARLKAKLKKNRQQPNNILDGGYKDLPYMIHRSNSVDFNNIDGSAKIIINSLLRELNPGQAEKVKTTRQLY